MLSLINIWTKNSLNLLSKLLKTDKLTEKNLTFKGTIDNIKRFENSKYLNLTIRIEKEICNDFITLDNINDKRIKIGAIISFDSKDLEINVLNDKIYIRIKKINFHKDENKIIMNKEYNRIDFNFFKFAYTYDNIYQENLSETKNYIYSIILKVNLIDIIENKYEFYDINNDKVPLDYSKIKHLIEGQKIYVFNSLSFQKTESCIQLVPLKYSSIIPVDENNIIYQNMKIDNENIVSLKGTIDKFNLAEEEIEIIDDNKKYLKIKLNNRLLKKISLGCICDFKCFKQKKNNEFQFTEFSDIIVYEKTLISFNIINNNRYYNQIIIDNKINDISNDNEMKIEINVDQSEKNELVKNIKLRRKENNEEAVDYNLEIDRGKENTHNLYLGQDGKFSYQIYYVAKNEEKIKQDFSIHIGNDNIKFNNFDYFGNKFKKRITFINIPTELYKIKELSSEKNDEKTISIKVLKLMNESENEYIFKILNRGSKKIKFDYDKLDLELINSFYDDYFKSITKLKDDHQSIKNNSKNKYHNLFYGTEKIENYMKYINDGISNYIYNNNEKDYLFLKKLCFAIIYYNNRKDDFGTTLNNYYNNFASKNQGIHELEFIERIKCLIALANEYKNGKQNPGRVEIVRVEDEKNEDYEYIIKAHKLFIEIINDLKETDLLFLIIQQFNSLIYEELNIKESMYSGSILNINDVKLEIYKNLNSFYLCSYYIRKLYAAIYINPKVIVIYPNEFLDDNTINYTGDNEIEDRKVSAVLFLLFHELCGHLKTHINNEDDSPRIIYLNDLKIEVIELKKNDSGFLLEFSFVQGSIEVENFVNSENSKKLLNKELYLGENFQELSKILNSIEDCIQETFKSKTDKINTIITKSKKYKDYDENTKKHIKFNFKNLNYNQLTNLLYGMDEQSLNENKEIYDYYLSFYFSDKNKKC